MNNGDEIFIEFIKTPELNSKVIIDKNGEVFSPELKMLMKLNIELSKLLESRYELILINPEIKIRIEKFKFIDSGIYNVDVEGEILLPLIEETYEV